MSLPDRFTDPIDRVSLVIPMFNESRHIPGLVSDVAAQDFPGAIETVVADGGSTDGSPDLLRDASASAGLALTVIDNPRQWVAPGLNSCVRHATGDLIVRLDCHTRYPSDYVSRLVRAAEQTGAASIGGLVVPVGETWRERAVACAMDSPFGGAHWTRYANRSERVDVDVIYLGAFRPEVFGSVGFFDESLVRNQDDEFSFRIRRSGGSIVLDPTIRAYYTPRGSYRKAFRQYFEYGLWKIPVMLKHRQVMSARSLAPLGLVASLGLLGVGATRSSLARRLLAAETAGYVLSAIAFAVAASRRRNEPLRMVPGIALVFPTFHLGYGIGLLRGIFAGDRARGAVRKPRRGRASA